MTSHVVVLNPGSVVVAIAIVLACVAMLVFSSRRQWLHWEKCTAARLALSATGHHRLLTGYRCFIALYCIITLLWVLIDGGAKAFLFYTVWSFIVVTVYFTLAAFKSIGAWRQGFDVSVEASTSLYDRFLFLLFELGWTVVFLVDVVLWGILYTHTRKEAHEPDSTTTCCHQFINYGSIVMHGANWFFMFGDVLLNKLTMVPAHVNFVVLFPVIFAFYSWIMKSAGYAYVYFFLDPGTKMAPLWYLGMCAGHVAFFFLAYGVIKLRDRCCSRSSDADEEAAEARYLLSTNSSMA